MSNASREYTDLERFIDRHCPLDAGFYFLKRFNGNDEEIRFPASGTFRAQHPFEAPAAPAGQYFVYYAKDSAGREVVPHVGREGPLRVVLRRTQKAHSKQRPAQGRILAVISKSLPEADSVPLLPATGEAYEDDAEGSLKAACIEAKKRELALELTAKEQRVMRRGAVNKELIEGYMLNRAHRLEVRDQSEAMFRVQNQTLTMSERNLVLIEKIQESLGRIAELEKAAAQRAATPPGPVDYTPVLHGVVSGIRDIAVSFMQREQRLNPRAEDHVETAASPKKVEQPQKQESLPGRTPPALFPPATTHASAPHGPQRLEAETAPMQVEHTATMHEIAEAEAARKANAPVLQPVPQGDASPADTVTDPALVLPSDAQELLGRILAGKPLGNSDEPLPRPVVQPVQLLDEVLVAPSKMDSDTARRLLRDGTAVEALGAFLFFNPMLRNILLQRRGS